VGQNKPDISIKKLKSHSIDEYWEDHWPSREFYVNENDVTRAQYEELRALIEQRAGERKIERFLSNNKESFSLILSLIHTGHHASWIFPKKQLRPSSGSPGGIIPDYLLAGKNSFGVQYLLVELKGAEHNAFTVDRKRVYLSSEANKGVCQLMNYIDICSRSQAYVRDELNLVDFREPVGVLLIGTEAETDGNDQKRTFKAAWNRLNTKATIRSYNSLLRYIARKLEDFGR